MNNEKYVNYYIETLTNTLTDVIIRNVSLQSSNKLQEDTIKEYEKTVEVLDAEIGRINDELNTIKNMKQEYENVKNKVQHIDSFKNELLKSRKENEELKEQLRYLQMTPSKKKKYDESKIQSSEISDGGSF